MNLLWHIRYNWFLPNAVRRYRLFRTFGNRPHVAAYKALLKGYVLVLDFGIRRVRDDGITVADVDPKRFKGSDTK